MMRLIKLQKLTVVPVLIFVLEKIVAVHLMGKYKKIAKVYMRLVVEIDGEDVYSHYMARSG